MSAMDTDWPDALERPEPAHPSTLDAAIDAVLFAGADAIEQLSRYAQLLSLLGARGQEQTYRALAQWHEASDWLRHVLEQEMED